jgi:multidrug efflux system membrane fusion protein
MIWSRLFAVLIVIAATLWIGSGVFGRTEEPVAAATEAPVTPPFRVAVILAEVQNHARDTVLSGRTEADDRASAVTRSAGTIEELEVRRGTVVAEGDVLAVLSDEARESQVVQARALVQQRKTDLDAKMKLIKRGIIAANEKSQLEADLRAAEAALAQAEAESDRSQVRAPISGVVSDVPVTTGQAMQQGGMVAQIVALDPMLAVVEVAERQLSGLKMGDRATVELVTGGSAEGAVRFISPTASEGTRTYRVDVEIPNEKGAIPDGVTAEVTFKLAAIPAVRVPRSALTFSAEGVLSVRTVDDAGVVNSVPVQIVQDGSDELWLAGPADGARIIVQGQDFVKEGQVVEAVPAGPPAAVSARS